MSCAQPLVNLLWSTANCLVCMWDSMESSSTSGFNVAKVLNSTLQWGWLCLACHLIHNVTKAKLDSLRIHPYNPIQHGEGGMPRGPREDSGVTFSY